jgi:hypothetical protein
VQESEARLLNTVATIEDYIRQHNLLPQFSFGYQESHM